MHCKERDWLIWSLRRNISPNEPGIKIAPISIPFRHCALPTSLISGLTKIPSCVGAKFGRLAMTFYTSTASGRLSQHHNRPSWILDALLVRHLTSKTTPHWRNERAARMSHTPYASLKQSPSPSIIWIPHFLQSQIHSVLEI